MEDQEYVVTPVEEWVSFGFKVRDDRVRVKG